MIPLHAIATSLQAYWMAHAPPGVPTVFPGMPSNVSQAEDWIELWIEQTEQPPTRLNAPDRFDLTLTLHCFSKSRTDSLRGQLLADETRDLLKHRSLPITDRENPSVMLGYLQIDEPATRNLTRMHSAENTPLQHWVLLFPARACARPI